MTNLILRSHSRPASTLSADTCKSKTSHGQHVQWGIGLSYTHSSRNCCWGPMIDPGRQILQKPFTANISPIFDRVQRLLATASESSVCTCTMQCLLQQWSGNASWGSMQSDFLYGPIQLWKKGGDMPHQHTHVSMCSCMPMCACVCVCLYVSLCVCVVANLCSAQPQHQAPAQQWLGSA